MKIGVFHPHRLPISAHNYIDNIVRELNEMKVECLLFNEGDLLLPQDVDLYWDPRAMGGGPPYKMLSSVDKPLVVTVHGASSFALTAKEHFSSIKSFLVGQVFKLKHLYEWRKFRCRCDAYVSVSSYGRWEISKYLNLNSDSVTPIFHGVDLDLFKQEVVSSDRRPYLLHVSQYQPKKNVDRIIEAYARLDVVNKPSLVLVAPQYPDVTCLPDGVELIREPQSHIELVRLYSGATAFVFPSLHETFGMPIVEAMACGCPVVTSNVTACPEVAGDAAILVNPRSVDEIAAAMEELISNEALRNDLRQKGLERAQQFTWKRSAEEHLKVFERVIHNASNSK